jgi:hypothetical protein
LTASRVLVAAVVALLIATRPAAAETTAEALRAFGLLGIWSPDCAGPIRHLYALHPGKPPTATAIIDGTEQAITEIEDATRSGDDRIRWVAHYRKYLPLNVGPQPWMPVPGERWETVLLKVGDKFRSWRSQRLDGAKILVRDGFNYEAEASPVGGPLLWRKTDEATPLFARCPDAR